MNRYSHAPQDYSCPICCAIQGIDNEKVWIKKSDIFYQDDLVVCFINSRAIKGNEHHINVVPLEHFENIFDIPTQYLSRVNELVQKVSFGLKELRKCDGVTIVQNNEPAGDQHAFHYHTHVIPRYIGDNFHVELWGPTKSEPEIRVPFAEEMRKFLSM